MVGTSRGGYEPPFFPEVPISTPIKDVVCACSDGRQLDDLRAWATERDLDPQLYGYDVPAGALRLVLGTEQQRQVALDDLALLVAACGAQTLWLTAHTGTCAGVAALGHRFDSPEHEEVATATRLAEAAAVIAADPRFASVSRVRLALATPDAPGSDDFTFRELSS